MPDGNSIKVGEPVPTDGKVHNVGPAPITFLKNEGGTIRQAPTPVKYVIRPTLSSDKAEIKAAFGSLTIADDADHPFAKGNSPTVLHIKITTSFSLVFFASATCPYYSLPLRNPDGNANINTGTRPVIYEGGVASYYIKQVVAPDGSMIYLAPENANPLTLSDRFELPTAAVGRYRVTVGAKLAYITYNSLNSAPGNPNDFPKITETVCTYGPDVVCEIDVTPPDTPNQTVVWFVPGPTVLSAIRPVNVGFLSPISEGGVSGGPSAFPVSNSLKIGTGTGGDIIKVSGDAASRTPGTVVFDYSYNPNFPVPGTRVHEFYSVGYEASACGTYINGNKVTIIPFDKSNRIG